MPSIPPDLSVLESVHDPSVPDPLSSVTRQERKALLVASLLGVAVARGGLVPSRIDALGIVLSPSEVTSLLYLISVVLAYLLTGFAIYAVSDLKHRRIRLAVGQARARPVVDEVLQRYKSEEGETVGSDQESNRELATALGPLVALADQTKLASGLLRTAGLRILFEVYLPIAVGATALGLVLLETDGFPGWQLVAWLLGLALAIAALRSAWYGRRRLLHWFAVRQHRYEMWQLKRITERIKGLPVDSPEVARLQERARQRLRRSLKGPRI
jgi:hypothetical protein